MFYLSICFNQQKRLLYKVLPLFRTSRSIRVTSLSFCQILDKRSCCHNCPKVLRCIVFNVKAVKASTQPDIIQSKKYFSTKSENKSFSDTFKNVFAKRKNCVMQLTRVFSGSIFQNCFIFQILLWNCVTLSRICQNVNIFHKSFTHTFLLQPSSVHQFGVLYTYYKTSIKF